MTDLAQRNSKEAGEPFAISQKPRLNAPYGDAEDHIDRYFPNFPVLEQRTRARVLVKIGEHDMRIYVAGVLVALDVRLDLPEAPGCEHPTFNYQRRCMPLDDLAQDCFAELILDYKNDVAHAGYWANRSN